MNKKIIGTIIVALLAIVGFSIYTVVNTKQIEVEQTALAKDMQADKEVAEAPVSNQQNDDGEYVNGEPDVAIQAKDFFDKCIQYSFNVNDTANVPIEITDFQEENFEKSYIQVMSKFYNNYKTIKLVDYAVTKVEKTKVSNKDGYAIVYTATIKDGDRTDTFEEEGKTARALISYENGKFLLEQFYTSN